MKSYSYNEEVSTATKQIIDIFNKIPIRRYEESTTGTVTKTISVPCLYGDRSRMLKSIENRGDTLKLPMIVISMRKIRRDIERVHSIHNGLFFNTGSYDIKNNMPVPIEIDYDLTIVTKYETDMDQILSNFLVHFQPQVYVVWDNPYNQKKIKAQIVFNGDIELEYPLDEESTEPERYYAMGTFRYKTWFFSGHGEDGYDTDNRIYHINMDDSDETDGGFRNFKTNRWYDVKNLTIDEFFENLQAGYVDTTQHDYLPIDIAIPENYYLDIYGELSGNTYYSYNRSDVEVLYENVNNPDLTLKLLSADIDLPQSFDDVNFADLWYRILSGDLQFVVE